MKHVRLIWVAILCCAAGSVLWAWPEAGKKTYAQKLVDDTLAKHREVSTLAIHVTPPDSSDNVIIASNFGGIGKNADADDLRVIESGRPNSAISKGGDRFSVELPLHDVGGKTIGVVAVAFPYTGGDNKSKFEKQAEEIRDEMSRRITYVANLMEPEQFDASLPTNTYAQKLVDQTLLHHPEVLILALHVTPPRNKDNVILASNIGRIGKKADEDDLRVIETGTPNLEVNKTGDRFEVEMPLQDIGGKTIGAISVVFPYKSGDDQSKLRASAEEIRNEVGKRIPTVARLCETIR